jgi:hypothetical protein
MIYPLLLGFVCLILDMLAAARVTAPEKDLEIALLRQPLRILERKATPKPRLSPPEKRMLVALGHKLKGVSQHFHGGLGQWVLLVKPDPLLKWHRDLVHRKWTFQRPKDGARPRIEAELEGLIVRLARENPLLGQPSISEGETVFHAARR